MSIAALVHFLILAEQPTDRPTDCAHYQRSKPLPPAANQQQTHANQFLVPPSSYSLACVFPPVAIEPAANCGPHSNERVGSVRFGSVGIGANQPNERLSTSKSVLFFPSFMPLATDLCLYVPFVRSGRYQLNVREETEAIINLIALLTSNGTYTAPFSGAHRIEYRPQPMQRLQPIASSTPTPTRTRTIAVKYQYYPALV